MRYSHYWKEVRVAALTALPVAIVSGIVQVSRNTPIDDAVIGGAITFVALSLLIPVVRHWVHPESRG
ncbi:hypothetical protein [Plantibacter flavus]|uniref:hypothetical protein n=1 Tax=Plantibacter flavus TaxID=150123 RepID=UPI00129472B8|nr:hypothetical protein [Plantibacter flavus]